MMFWVDLVMENFRNFLPPGEVVASIEVSIDGLFETITCYNPKQTMITSHKILYLQSKNKVNWKQLKTAAFSSMHLLWGWVAQFTYWKTQESICVLHSEFALCGQIWVLAPINMKIFWTHFFGKKCPPVLPKRNRAYVVCVRYRATAFSTWLSWDR